VTNEALQETLKSNLKINLKSTLTTNEAIDLECEIESVQLDLTRSKLYIETKLYTPLWKSDGGQTFRITLLNRKNDLINRAFQTTINPEMEFCKTGTKCTYEKISTSEYVFSLKNPQSSKFNINYISNLNLMLQDKNDSNHYLTLSKELDLTKSETFETTYALDTISKKWKVEWNTIDDLYNQVIKIEPDFETITLKDKYYTDENTLHFNAEFDGITDDFYTVCEITYPYAKDKPK
jgi:hypothetical protein